jgi:hypothetical protein
MRRADANPNSNSRGALVEAVHCVNQSHATDHVHSHHVASVGGRWRGTAIAGRVNRERQRVGEHSSRSMARHSGRRHRDEDTEQHKQKCDRASFSDLYQSKSSERGVWLSSSNEGLSMNAFCMRTNSTPASQLLMSRLPSRFSSHSSARRSLLTTSVSGPFGCAVVAAFSR